MTDSDRDAEIERLQILDESVLDMYREVESMVNG